jgi:branched-chain amino acid transport system ATP-binding protein
VPASVRPGRPEIEPLLSVVELVVRFGGVRAVDRVSFEVPQGSLHGLIGPNGAGKTTTIDALTGFVDHLGRVRFGGDEIGELAPHERARRGLARTWQSLELFDDLSVIENCRTAAEPQGLRTMWRDIVRPSRRRDLDAVTWAIELVGLGDDAHRHPRELSLGQRKLVALARGLSARPALLLLDEPAAGLDTNESLALGQRLHAVVDEGVTVLLVDHDMALVLGTCNRVTVLDFGRVISEGDPAEIRNDPLVVEAYLGEQHTGAAG